MTDDYLDFIDQTIARRGLTRILRDDPQGHAQVATLRQTVGVLQRLAPEAPLSHLILDALPTEEQITARIALFEMSVQALRDAPPRRVRIPAAQEVDQ